MRTMRLLLCVLFLPLFACEGPPDEMPLATDAGTAAAVQMIRTFRGMEPAKASWLLPIESPNAEISAERWEALRTGKMPPLRVQERQELGMEVSAAFCSVLESCDVYNCDGVDSDGIQVDGVNETEIPDTLVASSYRNGWQNCKPAEWDGSNFRCDRWAGGSWYVGTVGTGYPTRHQATPGEHWWFTEFDMTGACARGFNTSAVTMNDMGDIYPGNVFKDSVSSVRWANGCTNGSKNLDMYDWSGAPIWSSYWTVQLPVGAAGQYERLISGPNNAVASFKICRK